MRTRVLALVTGFALASPAWGSTPEASAKTDSAHTATCRGAAPSIECRPIPDFVALHRVPLRHVRLVRRPYRGAYHAPPFDQAEAEAEVHTQYRYRTPYLPYWVFP